MIPLRLPAEIEARKPFVTRLVANAGEASTSKFDNTESVVLFEDAHGVAFVGNRGVVSIDGVRAGDVLGDIVLVDPDKRSVERLIRASSHHNTLLVTERCDQLCQMCSQPPKKTHEDRFELLREACLLAPLGETIGITGGEPTLYKAELLDLVETVLAARDDLAFHILSNGQHFTEEDADRFRDRRYDRVVWGIPLYAPTAACHDAIVAKIGAFDRLHESFATLVRAGARIELRTVVLTANAARLPALARHIVQRLPFIESWSIMQLEAIGYAKNRWDRLLFDHACDFSAIAEALDLACLHGLSAQLFNFPLCTVPDLYRSFAVRSISDWKQKYVEPCETCSLQSRCAGFFEWHPPEHAAAWARAQ